MPKALPQRATDGIVSALHRMRERLRLAEDSKWQKPVAKAIKVDASTVSRVAAGKQGGSLALAEALGVALNEDPAVILYGIPGDRDVPPLKQLPNFAKHLRKAKEEAETYHYQIPDWAWAALPEMRTRPPTRAVEPQLLMRLALAISIEEDSPSAPTSSPRHKADT